MKGMEVEGERKGTEDKRRENFEGRGGRRERKGRNERGKGKKEVVQPHLPERGCALTKTNRR